MNSHRTKLEQQQAEDHAAERRQQSTAQSFREYESVEHMLREDAASMPVPRAVQERLSRSVQQHPRPRPSWWERWSKGRSRRRG